MASKKLKRKNLKKTKMTAKEAKELATWNRLSEQVKSIINSAIEKGEYTCFVPHLSDECEVVLKFLGYDVLKIEEGGVINWEK